MAEKEDKRFEVLKKFEVDKIQKVIEEKFKQKFRNDDGQFHLYHTELNQHGRLIIDFLIEQLAIARTKIWLRDRRE